MKPRIVLFAIAALCACHLAAADEFAVVNLPGIDGVIIPATNARKEDLITYKYHADDYWTPSVDDVRPLEERLKSQLQHVIRLTTNRELRGELLAISRNLGFIGGNI